MRIFFTRYYFDFLLNYDSLRSVGITLIFSTDYLEEYDWIAKYTKVEWSSSLDHGLGLFRVVVLFDFAILPLAFKNATVCPAIDASAVLQAVLVLTFVSLKQLVVLVVPVAFTSPFHLAATPAALVLMIYADKGPESFHLVGFETSLINCSVRVLDPSLPVPLILIKVSLVN